MKRLIEPEQRGRVTASIVVVAFAMGLFALLYYFSALAAFVRAFIGILRPVIVGVGVAFLLNPIVKRLDRLLQKGLCRKKPRTGLSRGLATLIALVLLITLIILFCVILLPQLITSIRQLGGIVSGFLAQNSTVVNDFLVQHELDGYITVDGSQLVIAWEQLVSELTRYLDSVLDMVTAMAGTVYTVVYQLFVGLICSFYLLLYNDRICSQAKKIVYAFASERRADQLIRWTRRASGIFTGFITGKVIDSLIIGVVCYLGMLIFRIDYPVLISVLIGATNIIPVFGPLIGAVPSVLILLIINPYHALVFAIFVLILQQVDGNILGPYILRDYVGISPMWILLSVIIGGGLFGFIGMLLSVPTFAFLYAVVRTIVENRLRSRGLPTRTEDYRELPERLTGKKAK